MEYKNEQLPEKELKKNFLEENTGLVKLTLPNIKQERDNFLEENEHLAELNLQSLEEKSSGRRR